MHPFDLKGISQAVDRISGKPVYFTLDLDVLDPSVFPGTGTPEAGGVNLFGTSAGSAFGVRKMPGYSM